MNWRTIRRGTLTGLLFVALAAAAALAASLDDGDYTLTLPGVGDFEFTVDSGDETVVAVAAPDGYEVDDDEDDKAAWKNAASLEVEAKLDKVEADYDWSGGSSSLSLPGGGSITITPPDGDGDFTVTASGGWFAFGGGSDWYVADNEDITLAEKFFKVEADDDGIEIKAVDSVDDGFLNDLDEDEDEDDDD